MFQLPPWSVDSTDKNPNVYESVFFFQGGEYNYNLRGKMLKVINVGKIHLIQVW